MLEGTWNRIDRTPFRLRLWDQFVYEIFRHWSKRSKGSHMSWQAQSENQFLCKYCQFYHNVGYRNAAGQLHTCQPIQFTSIKYNFLIILGGYGHTGKWIQENIIFMWFCCCFKLSKKTEKLLNKQPTHTITKRTLTGLVQYAKKSCQKWDLKLCMRI